MSSTYLLIDSIERLKDIVESSRQTSLVESLRDMPRPVLGIFYL